MVDSIGWVGVGDWVTRRPGRTAPVYQVTRITDRWIHLEAVDGATVSVPVAAWRSLTPVGDTDPRVIGRGRDE